ncbi:MAG TPA: peptidylprolyl isomerase [Thermodesulfobacteriota bacterium]|nr:peptidylprolyl isomerase [Thermodesulfobacteriota bacterium]
MKKLFPLLVFIILFAAGCERFEKKQATTSTEETTQKKVVARVNGRPIYEEDLKGKPLQTAIDYEILYEAGLKRGLDNKIEQDVEDYKKRLIVTKMQREIMDSLPKEELASDTEIEEYYKQNEMKYKILSLKEISVEDKNLADEIQKRAATGEDFEKIASDYSNSGKNVGVRDLKFNRRYNNQFMGKEVGSVSEVIQEGNKFIILKLTETKDIPLDKAKQAIKYTVAAKKRAQAVHEFAEKAKNENNIKVEIIEIEEVK